MLIRLEGIIVKTIGGGKYVLCSDGKYFTAFVRGRLKKNQREYKTVAVVGDKVHFHIEKNGSTVIEEILPRFNKISRKVAGKRSLEHALVANIDQIIIFTSLDNPPIKTGLIDRFLIVAEKEKIPAIICINKIDLGGISIARKIERIYKDIGYEVLLTSVLNNIGIKKFKSVVKNKRTVLMGHSGVGKSSIINLIQPQIDLKVREVSEKTGKGKHTTAGMEMIEFDFGGYIIDTPGLREFSIWNFRKENIRLYIREFVNLNNMCKFKDCLHLTEPDCAVKKSLKNKNINPERYKNYKRILESID